jgi:hypothetical protein
MIDILNFLANADEVLAGLVGPVPFSCTAGVRSPTTPAARTPCRCSEPSPASPMMVVDRN